MQASAQDPETAGAAGDEEDVELAELHARDAQTPTDSPEITAQQDCEGTGSQSEALVSKKPREGNVGEGGDHGSFCSDILCCGR